MAASPGHQGAGGYRTAPKLEGPAALGPFLVAFPAGASP